MGVRGHSGGDISKAEAVHPLHGDDEVSLIAGVAAAAELIQYAVSRLM